MGTDRTWIWSLFAWIRLVEWTRIEQMDTRGTRIQLDGLVDYRTWIQGYSWMDWWTTVHGFKDTSGHVDSYMDSRIHLDRHVNSRTQIQGYSWMECELPYGFKDTAGWNVNYRTRIQGYI
jgi:hypothetical protein